MARSAAALLPLAAFAAVAAAQTPEKPLGDLLESLPPAETAPRAAERESASPPPPRPGPGGVVTTDLPPSEPARAEGLDEQPVSDAEPKPDEETEADAAWAALQERRRAEINAVEGPVVDRLNARMVARQEAFEHEVEAERAAHERRVAAHAAEVRRLEAEHRAALERHRLAEERLRALYQACLAGDEPACAALPR